MSAHLHGHLEKDNNFLKPVFYVSSAVGSDIRTITQEIVGDDPIFVLGSPDGNLYLQPGQ
jgi:hypothetical protein